MITVISFSFEKGLPEYSETDMVYIFDCRVIKDPAWERFGHLTGKDNELRIHFDQQKSMQDFLTLTRGLLYFIQDTAQEVQETRNTIIAFGCTHGKHRSVYCAEVIANDLCERYGYQIQCLHREQT